jgi:predicted metal-dependent peptidase
MSKKSTTELVQADISSTCYFSTFEELIKTNEYFPGKFFQRVLRRMILIDDFRFDGIACIQFNPQSRRMVIKINPHQFWSFFIKGLAKNILNDKQIYGLDKVLSTCQETGRWDEESFKYWIGFFTATSVMKYTNKKSKKKNRGISSFSFGCDEEEKSFPTCIVSVLIHEVLHCLWNHLTVTRRQDNHKLANISQDFAINQTLSFLDYDATLMTKMNKPLLHAFYMGGAPVVDEHKKAFEKIDKFISDNKEKEITPTQRSMLIQLYDDIDCDFFANGFLNQSFEYYYNLLQNASEKMIEDILGGSGLGQFGKTIYDFFKHGLSGKPSTDGDDEQDIKSACDSLRSPDGINDFIDFNTMSSDAKKVAGNDLKQVVDDMLARGEINDISDLENQRPFGLNKAFVNVIKNLYRTDTKDWDRLLKTYIMRAVGNMQFDYTTKRESRAIAGMIPGKARLKSLNLNIIMDVSGSINFEDYNRFINEIDKIAKQVCNPKVRYIQFHSTVSLDIFVPLKKIREVGIPETGGTNLGPALNRLRDERNKKLTIVFTDGYVEDIKNDYNYPIVIFVSSSGSDEVCRNLVEKGWRVIHQDGLNDWA